MATFIQFLVAVAADETLRREIISSRAHFVDAELAVTECNFYFYGKYITTESKSSLDVLHKYFYLLIFRHSIRRLVVQLCRRKTHYSIIL